MKKWSLGRSQETIRSRLFDNMPNSITMLDGQKSVCTGSVNEYGK
jgi:hypothetical protein